MVICAHLFMVLIIVVSFPSAEGLFDIRNTVTYLQEYVVIKD